MQYAAVLLDCKAAVVISLFVESFGEGLQTETLCSCLATTDTNLRMYRKTMYAVILTGGKQYRVSEGDVLDVEKLAGNVGDKVEFPVLMTCDNGAVVAGADVKAVATAEIVSFVRAKKVVVFKYKPKKNERKKNGHRQGYTRVKIVKIA